VQQNRAGEQKSYKLRGLFRLLLIALFFPSFLSASFENFKRQQQQSFANYKDSNDALFKNYLLDEWSEYKALGKKDLYEKPKPKNKFLGKDENGKAIFSGKDGARNHRHDGTPREKQEAPKAGGRKISIKAIKPKES